MNQFFYQYKVEVNALLEQIDSSFLSDVIGILSNAYINDKHIFIIGNGGSAAIANHFACDLAENTHDGNSMYKFQITSLCTNPCTILAISNDISFTDVFKKQLINTLRQKDILIAISASGNSINLVTACEYAKNEGATVITMSGFSGGRISEFADISLGLDSKSPSCIEDVVHILLHAIVVYFRSNHLAIEASK